MREPKTDMELRLWELFKLEREEEPYSKQIVALMFAVAAILTELEER